MVSPAGLVAKDKVTLWRVLPLGCVARTESGLALMTRYAEVKRITYNFQQLRLKQILGSGISSVGT